MLKTLSIKNFAVIEDLFVDFSKGLSILTGETGAGKSIIIDAISLLMGKRANYDLIRTNSKKSTISGEFLVKSRYVIEFLADYGIEVDQYLIIDRTLYQEGRSNIRLNGILTPLNVIKEVAPYLVDIHSQHDSTSFLRKKSHEDLLDSFIKGNHQETLIEYKKNFSELKKVKKILLEFESNNNDSLLEIYQFQLDEIENANISEEEENSLIEEKKIISNAQKIKDSVDTCVKNLTGNSNILDLLYEVKEEVSSLSEFKSDFNEMSSEVSDIYFRLEDLATQISASSFDSYHEVSIDDIESRLYEIQRLKMKYGGTFESLYASRDEMQIKVDDILNKDIKLKEYQISIDNLSKKCQQLAMKLTETRKKQSIILEKQIKEYLDLLYLSSCDIKFNITPTADFSTHGLDFIELHVKTNVGDTFKPLSKVVSGGELSRIMLSIKAVLMRNYDISTVVFDEIDTGVSGKVSTSFGELMKIISKDTQVLTITHIPNVAVLADNHYQVSKSSKENKTITDLKLLDYDEKVLEIASMISSEEISVESIEYAKKMLS